MKKRNIEDYTVSKAPSLLKQKSMVTHSKKHVKRIKTNISQEKNSSVSNIMKRIRSDKKKSNVIKAKLPSGKKRQNLLKNGKQIILNNVESS